MEESGAVAGSDTSNRWIVDPLDGTTNFLHGIPHFAISIALEQDGEPYAGVIYNPVPDEMYVAERGSGAFLNGRRLRVSGRRDVEQALFATGIPFKGLPDHPLFLRQLAAVMAVSSGVRRFGAAALDLAYVAAGRYDAFWENGLNPWDIAAGIVLVREAGGLASPISKAAGRCSRAAASWLPPAAACMRSCCGCWPRRRRHIRTPSLRHRRKRRRHRPDRERPPERKSQAPARAARQPFLPITRKIAGRTFGGPG